MSDCRNCGRANQAYLCDDCATQLTQMLDQIPWLLDELDARIQKVDRVNIGTIGRTRRQDSLDVMDFDAAEESRQVRKLLLRWVIRVVEHHTGRIPPGLATVSTANLARWLHVNITAITRLDTAGQLYRDIRQLVGTDTARTGTLVTAINPTQRHLVGPCPTVTGRDRQGQPTHCGHILYADTYDRTVTCPDCRRDIDIEKTRRAAAAERDYQTEQQLLEVLANCGEPIDPDTLTAWIKARRLRPAGRLHNGTIVPTHTHDNAPYVYSVKRARKLRARDNDLRTRTRRNANA
ncbi:DUF1922 domain-containing protein [Mycolicibacterium litorale]|uniref:DUF1922 domain-containing protein n=1 Tax=Mycolicibacterium litorale TaxID=758802 RepID=UPI003CEA26FB